MVSRFTWDIACGVRPGSSPDNRASLLVRAPTGSRLRGMDDENRCIACGVSTPIGVLGNHEPWCTTEMRVAAQVTYAYQQQQISRAWGELPRRFFVAARLDLIADWLSRRAAR